MVAKKPFETTVWGHSLPRITRGPFRLPKIAIATLTCLPPFSSWRRWEWMLGCLVMGSTCPMWWWRRQMKCSQAFDLTAVVAASYGKSPPALSASAWWGRSAWFAGCEPSAPGGWGRAQTPQPGWQGTETQPRCSYEKWWILKYSKCCFMIMLQFLGKRYHT